MLLGLVALVVGGWLVCSVLKPPPDGFAPTVGQARGVGDEAPAIFQYTIDARNRQHWAYFNFSTDAEVVAAHESLDWDVAFRRTDVLTNGGETNPTGQGGAVDLGIVPLDEASQPGGGFLADTMHEERGLENPAMHGWYGYDWMTHVVSSKEHTYAVRTASGETIMMTFLSYYCDDGSAGCITFQYTTGGNERVRQETSDE